VIIVWVTAIAACVGDEPELVPTSGAPDASVDAPSTEPDADSTPPTPDAGNDANDSEEPALPRIGSWSVNPFPTSEPKSTCLQNIVGAMTNVGGGYVVGGTADYVRYGNRPGDQLVATCVNSAGVVLFQGWSIASSEANIQNDETRLHTLWQGKTAPAVSAAGTGLPINARERIEQLSSALPAAACQTRAKTALATLAASTPALTHNPWDHLIGAFAAATGSDGTTASISCLDQTAYAVLDVYTVSTKVDPDAILNALAAALQNMQ
jgi:hypothetical protein